MLLDLVEVAKSHTGINLAEAFEKVLGGRVLDPECNMRQRIEQ